MIFSRIDDAPDLTRSTRRLTTRPGETFSASRSTSWLRSRRVPSMSRWICSGVLNVVSSTRLQGAGDLLDRLHGPLRLRIDSAQLLAAGGVQHRADDAPDHRDDQRGPTGVHHVLQPPPQRAGEEQRHHVAGEAGPAEHAGGLAGLADLGLDLDLGEFQFLPHEGGKIAAHLTDELTDRLLRDVLLRRRRCADTVRVRHRCVPSSYPAAGYGGGAGSPEV